MDQLRRPVSAWGALRSWGRFKYILFFGATTAVAGDRSTSHWENAATPEAGMRATPLAGATAASAAPAASAINSASSGSAAVAPTVIAAPAAGAVVVPSKNGATLGTANGAAANNGVMAGAVPAVEVPEREHLRIGAFDPQPERDAKLLARIKSWSLEERAGQLLLVGFRSFEQVRRVKPGGVVLFSWSLQDIDQTRKLISSIKSDASKHFRSPLFVAIDHEGGKVLRLRKGMTFFPDAAAVGAIQNPETAFKFGEAMGLELASLGIHMNFAPVLDLGNARSFLENRVWGEDPETVAELTRAYIEGLYASRILAIPKHFPGHGGTHKDSHFFLPVISKSFERLWKEDLVPFRSAVQDSIAGVMTAHVEIPSVDRIPASLSENFLQKLLRDRLGFNGLVITDDLEMAGVSKVLPEAPENLAFRALKAGTNMVLVVWSENTQNQIIRRVVSAVKTGEVSEDWLNQKVLKVQQLKAEYFGEGVPEDPYWRENIRRPETLQLAAEIFHKAPVWHAGFESTISQAFRDRWDEAWSVVLPEEPHLLAFWKRQRPQDRVLTIGKRAGEPEIQKLKGWLQRQIDGPRPLWVVTGPRASASEEAFQVIRTELSAAAKKRPSTKSAVVWVHQGSRPVALLKDGDKIPLGIVSLYSGSLSGFKEFFNSMRQPQDRRQISSVGHGGQVPSVVRE